MKRLEGRVAIVTGAGRGIGAAVARLMAAEGAQVVVNDLGVTLAGTEVSGHASQEVVQEIKAAGGVAVANSADVADHEAAAGLVRHAIEAFGRLDVVVNAAGILRDKMIFDMSIDDWESVVKVHLTGTFNTTKHASVYWRDLHKTAANHRIINFTSRAGLFGAPSQPSYAAAKLGVVGFTYSCANALRSYGVTVNAVSPSAETRMTGSVPMSFRAPSYVGEGLPDNVAPAVAYLASTRSAWCNGQVISARGHEIGLYGLPEEIRLLVSPQPWSLDQAFDLIETTFRSAIIHERLYRSESGEAGG